MLRLWLLVLTFVMLPTARSQEHLRLRGGLAIGYRAFELPVRILDQQRDTVIIPDRTLSAWYGGLFGIDVPLVTDLMSTSWIQLDYSKSIARHHRDVLVLIDGNPTQGVIAQEHTTRLSSLSAGTGLIFYPARSFGISLGVGAYLPFDMRLAVSEFVESPSGVTFVGGSAERQLSKSQYMGDPVPSAQLKAALQFQQPMTEQLDLLVIAQGDMTLTSPMTSSQWKPWSIGLSVQLGWKPAVENDVRNFERSVTSVESAPRNVMRVERVTRDTITIVDPWLRGRTDTVWVDKQTQRTDTIHARPVDNIHTDAIDTVLTRTHIQTQKHLPHPELFLAVVNKVEMIGTGNDSTLTLLANVAVTADTSTTTFIQVFHESTLVYSTVSNELTTEVRVRLADVIPDFIKRKELTLVVSANTLDAVGNKASSAPLRLDFFRSRPNSTLQRR